jgi:oxygen-dependent protoporphyrinogen oxidase
VDVAMRDLHKTMTLRQEPDFYRVTRLQNAIPYVVGHQAWAQDVSGKVATSLPGVILAGASYGGVGVPDCIDQGKKAASKLIEMALPGN